MAEPEVTFETPTYDGGWLRTETEEEARDLAGSRMGDGSGRITKFITIDDYSREENRSVHTRTVITEYLPPLTSEEFSADGLARHERYMLRTTCQHLNKSDWYLASGAGCSTDYARRCVDCGTVTD